MSAKAPVFWNLISGMSFALLLGFATLYRDQKSKSDFFHLTSKLISISNELDIQGHINPNNEPIRYLKVEDYPKYFRLRIGDDLDSSKPDYQRIDELKTDDIITVYYDENPLSNDAEVSNLAYFIDKSGKPYFIRGKQNNLVYYFIGICFSVIAVSYFLKKTGRIS